MKVYLAGKYDLIWTRLSRHKSIALHVKLCLFTLAYNLGNFMRRLALPEEMKHWSLTSLQTKNRSETVAEPPIAQVSITWAS